ncbi:MAG: PilW family protein [Peptococcales bacterium]|jgi:prepilin-type N-terminal cleavage/methylation domain-containing protein
MNNKGFTLIEVIVVIAILSLVIASLAGILESGMYSFHRVNNQSELQQNLRTSLNLIISDIQTAKSIKSISTNEITLNNDEGVKTFFLDYDNKASEHPYHIKGKTLYYKKNNSSPEPVTLFIKELNFDWQPKDGDPQDINFVVVTIKGELPNGKEMIFNSGAEIKWKSFGFLTE